MKVKIIYSHSDEGLEFEINKWLQLEIYEEIKEIKIIGNHKVLILYKSNGIREAEDKKMNDFFNTKVGF